LKDQIYFLSISYITSDAFVIHPTVDNTKEYLVIDRTSEQLQLASKQNLSRRFCFVCK